MRLPHNSFLTQCLLSASTFALTLGMTFPTFAADRRAPNFNPREKTTSWLSTSVGEIGTIDTTTGLFTKMADSPIFRDIALSEDGQLFGVSDNRLLYNINTTSGISSAIGDAGVTLYALGFSADNELYGAGDSSFYKVDPLTGAASLVSSIPDSIIADIVFDPSKNRFLATSSALEGNIVLLSIDLMGNAMKIGDIGFSQPLGLFFENGTLFGYNYERQQIIIDPTTGAGTFDKTVTGTNGGIRGGASLPSAGLKTSVPEPNFTLGLFIFGALGGSSLLDRKQRKVLRRD